MGIKSYSLGIIIVHYSLFAQIIVEKPDYYTVATQYYRVKVSKVSGMITNMNMIGSDRELIADTGNYTMFFTEFIQERTDGKYTLPYYPPLPQGSIETRIELNTDKHGIISVEWDTGKINANWTFIFIYDSPLFRASIERVVVQDGVYSNAQNCVMYSSDMDQSMIIDYTNTPLVTMGAYDGNYAHKYWHSDGAADYSPWTTTHSLWTSFDFSTPRFLPAMIWRQSQENITVGAITTWTSANQRSSFSYHGGGASHTHPGYAEGQWNWFGKSDAESIYLTKSTKYSMELFYYQNYGPIDSLLQLLENEINPDIYVIRQNVDYRVASWGGRTSRNPRYFWKYPQITTNAITSQRLFRPHSFAIPRSQDGTRDNHLFSFLVLAGNQDNVLNIAPNYGIESLYDSVNTTRTDSGWIGSMQWTIDGIKHVMNYLTYQNREEITIHGTVSMNINNNYDRVILLFPISTRAICERKGNPRNWKVWSVDSILDTISITISGSASIYSSNLENDTLRMQIAEEIRNGSRIFTYSFVLSPSLLNDSYFKSYFVKPIELMNQDTMYFEPSSQYYCLGYQKEKESVAFQFWIDDPVTEVNFYAENFSTYSLTDEFSGKIFTINGKSSNYYAIKGKFSRGFYSLRTNSNTRDKIYDYIDIYPNPTRNGNITIQLNQYLSLSGNIKIFDIRGSLLKKILIKDYIYDHKYFTISLHDLGLPSGIYLVNFNVGKTNEFHKVTYLK